HSALFLLVESWTEDKVMDKIKGFDAKVLQTAASSSSPGPAPRWKILRRCERSSWNGRGVSLIGPALLCPTLSGMFTSICTME
ncbi:hypothetical protein ACFLTC_01160, partial [Chloroflexota bacterium]